jgi:ATP-dependent DNA ligase
LHLHHFLQPAELSGQAEAEDTFVVVGHCVGLASPGFTGISQKSGKGFAYSPHVMKFNPLPAWFVIPAQPVKASKPPVGTDWVHEIKHDDYRIMVRRDGPAVRLYSRNATDWTTRLSAIATAARKIKAKSFTIDGEAVVLGA